MNGTKDKHSENGFENYGLTFKKNSSLHYILKKYNTLEGTELSNVLSYFEKEKYDAYNEFWETGECKKCVTELMDGVANVYVKFSNDFTKQDNFEETVDILINQIIS
jgi:hypothetical protein